MVIMINEECLAAAKGLVAPLDVMLKGIVKNVGNRLLEAAEDVEGDSLEARLHVDTDTGMHALLNVEEELVDELNALAPKVRDAIVCAVRTASREWDRDYCPASPVTTAARALVNEAYGALEGK